MPYHGYYRVGSAVLIGALALVGASCGPRRAKVFPVEGQVLYEGKPATGALVFLQPQADEFVGGTRPFAKVDENGGFRISTYKTADGAAAGTYRVFIFWEKRPLHGDRGEIIPLGVYGDPVMSPLVVEIKEQPNVLAPFAVTSMTPNVPN